MCREHIKTWYEGTGLNFHASMKKARSLLQSIRKYGLTSTLSMITGRFSAWLSKF